MREAEQPLHGFVEYCSGTSPARTASASGWPKYCAAPAPGSSRSSPASAAATVLRVPLASEDDEPVELPLTL